MDKSLAKSENLTNESISPNELKYGLSHISQAGNVRTNYVMTYVADSPRLPGIADRSGNITPALYVPSRFTHDIFLSLDLDENFDMKLGLRNITNEKYWDWISVAGLPEGGAQQYLNPGANLSLDLRYTF